MNFREWLKILENSRPATSQGVKHGPDSMYGGPRTMLPISWGFDNRAVGSVIGGIGDARAKIRAQMGAEPGSVPHISNLEDIRRSSLKAIYMPLQLLPEDLDSENIRPLNKSTVMRAKQLSSNPLKDEGVYNVEGGGEGVQAHLDPADLNKDPDRMKTRLYTFTKDDRHPRAMETAINFTTALMQASLSSMEMFGRYSHLLDLDRMYVKDRKMFPVPVREDEYRTSEDAETAEPGHNPEFYMVMMCTFEINPKNKNAHIGGDVWDELESMRDASRKAAEAPKPAPVPAPPSTPPTT